MALREVILTQLTQRKMTGYEIAGAFDRTLSWFWQASHQQIYRELARLDADGCVSFEAVAQNGKPDKKVYAITRKGRQELKRWIAEPTPPPRPQYDLLVKLLAGVVLDRKAIREEIARAGSMTAHILAQFEDMERACKSQPLETMTEYDRTLYLALRRGLVMVKAQMLWLEEVQAFLDTGHLVR
jgi:DNA-binding PadR family transcriptional regulator